jgi:hypothetical protein
MTFCSDAGERDELLRRFASLGIEDGNNSQSTASANATSTLRPTVTAVQVPSSDTKDLSVVMMALRKLREGIVASKRVDEFAIQAYLFCIRLSILVKHHESYYPAILHVLRVIHPVQSLTSIELNEVVAYLVLDAACRRKDLDEAYILRRRYQLRDSKVDIILDSLAHDNYFSFRRMKRSVDGHKSKLMEYAEDELRRHTLKCFARAYFTVDLEYLESCTGSDWAELKANDDVGWDIEDKKVVIRTVKRR